MPLLCVIAVAVIKIYRINYKFMKKKVLYLSLTVFLLIWSVMPVLAANDVTFDGTVNASLSGLSITVILSGGQVDSITVNSTTIDVTMSAGSSITISSSDQRTISATDAGFSKRSFYCPSSGNSSLILEKASGSAQTTTISFSSGTCTATEGGGGGGGGSIIPPTTTTTTATTTTTIVPSTGSGVSTVSISAGAGGVLGNIDTSGTNAVMGSNATASFTPLGASGVTTSHNIKTTTISENSVTVEISSDPKTLTIALKKTKQVDLDGDGFNDLAITFNQVTDSKADLTLKEIKVVKISGITPGSLVKRADMSAVYYYGKDSKRYVFPNDKNYFTWYSDFKNVKTIAADDLASLDIGSLVTYKPGVKMVKIQTDPKVYAIAKGGVLRWVKSEAVAKSLYGNNWNKQIDDVPDSFFTSYTIGTDIETAADFDQAAEQGISNINTDKDLE